jgi:fermentation-respiration switch protein FrsA (DUF1100 family)
MTKRIASFGPAAASGLTALAFALLAPACLADPLPPSAFPFVPEASVRVEHVASLAPERGIRIEDVHILAGKATIRGRFVEPVRSGIHPGVLFVHWLGDEATTNLSEFNDEAQRLARAGIASLSVDAMWAAHGWFETGRSTDTDFAASLQQVAELRASLDALAARSGVDNADLAYVGHDFGAMYGAVLSGLDARPRYYVFISPTTSFADWYLLGKKPADIPAFRRQMEPLEPLQYLRASHGHDYLFQFGLHDEYVSTERAQAFFDAAPSPKALFLYDEGHPLRSRAAVEDRTAWLIERLKGA